MRVLLHSCCGPCASACVPRLKEAGHEVVMYFANSNIDTEAEFEKRREAAAKLAAADGVEMAVGKYDHAEWEREVARGYEDEPEKGERCRRCFRYNLGKAAAYAREHGFDGFCTSLTVSPHKMSPVIFEEGRRVRENQAVSLRDEVAAFLEEDFKKKEGFKLSVARAKELGLYRQGYCGCEYSRGLKVARNFWQRARGLIGSAPLKPGAGLLIPKCNAIHTFFMSYAIDATFIDGKGNVVKVVRNVSPWKFLVWGGWRARAVIETAACPDGGGAK